MMSFCSLPPRSLSLIVSDDESTEFSREIREKGVSGEMFCSVIFGRLLPGGALRLRMNEYGSEHLDVLASGEGEDEGTGAERAVEVGLFLTRTVLGLDANATPATPFTRLYLETEYDLSRFLFHLLNIRTALSIHVRCTNGPVRTKYSLLLREFQDRFFLF